MRVKAINNLRDESKMPNELCKESNEISLDTQESVAQENCVALCTATVAVFFRFISSTRPSLPPSGALSLGRPPGCELFPLRRLLPALVWWRLRVLCGLDKFLFLPQQKPQWSPRSPGQQFGKCLFSPSERKHLKSRAEVGQDSQGSGTWTGRGHTGDTFSVTAWLGGRQKCIEPAGKRSPFLCHVPGLFSLANRNWHI